MEKDSAVNMANLQLRGILYGIDTELFDVERKTALAGSAVNRNLAKPDTLMRLVEELVASNNHIMGGSVALEPGYYNDRGAFMEYVSINPSGEVERRHLGMDGDYRYTAMEWYASAKESCESRWSEPYFDEGGGERMMTTFTIPIFDSDGIFVGVVTADIALDDFVRRIEGLRPYPDSYTVVASTSGTIISHPDSSVILNRTLSSLVDSIGNDKLRDVMEASSRGMSGISYLRLGGTDKFICYSALSRTGWMVVYICPYGNILASLGSSVIWLLIVLGLALLLLGLIVQRIIKNATEPIRILTDAAYSVSEGDFNAVLPEVKSNDEIGRLRLAFAHMQESLSDYIARLTESTREKQRIESELTIARRIQLSLVPKTFSPFAEYKDLSLYAMLIPAKEVGGDFYDFFFKDNKLYFTIGDVSGKGVPAALVMSVTRTLFRVNGALYDNPIDIVSAINRVISEDNEENMFVTMFVGALDLATGELNYCNAAHDYPLLAGAGAVDLCRSDTNLPTGVDPDFQYKGGSFSLNRGETLLLYTDGVVEAKNDEDLMFGEDRLIEYVTDHYRFGTKQLLAGIVGAVNDFAGKREQFDDITLMAISLNP